MQYISTLTIIIMYAPILFLVIEKSWVILWKLATLKTYITIDSRLNAFSRVSCRLQVLGLSCDWLIWTSATITIGSTNITWGILHCRNFPAIWLSRALRKLSTGTLAMKAGKRMHYFVNNIISYRIFTFCGSVVIRVSVNDVHETKVKRYLFLLV